MILYDGLGPNPAAVRMFIAERGVPGITLVKIDQHGAENRREPYLSKNPTGTVPALELEDGTVFAEVTAVCEYLDEIADGPGLIGETPVERALTRMWARRIDLRICEPMIAGFRYGPAEAMFRDRMRCLPEAADGLMKLAQDGYAWMDAQMADGRDYLAGARFTLADILLFCFADFGMATGQQIPDDKSHLLRWYGALKTRASAGA